MEINGIKVVLPSSAACGDVEAEIGIRCLSVFDAVRGVEGEVSEFGADPIREVVCAEVVQAAP